MKEDELKVLKTLSEATGHMDLKGFAEKVNLAPGQAIHEIQELAKDGFLQKVGAGYGVTQKGRTALKAFAPVSNEQGFDFYFRLDQPLGLAANSLARFYTVLKHIQVESVEFHLYRGDFQNWLRDVCKDPEVAAEFEKIKVADVKGESLRAELLKVLEGKYGIEGLL